MGDNDRTFRKRRLAECPSIVVHKALSCYWTLQVLGLGLINVLWARR